MKKWFEWDRLKAEISSVLHVEFPAADTEATLQLMSWLGVLWKVFFIHIDNEESHLQGKPNEGTDHSIVYNVYNKGKSVLCVFDKPSCSLRAEMPESFIKKTLKKKNKLLPAFSLKIPDTCSLINNRRISLLGSKYEMMQLYSTLTITYSVIRGSPCLV